MKILNFFSLPCFTPPPGLAAFCAAMGIPFAAFHLWLLSRNVTMLEYSEGAGTRFKEVKTKPTLMLLDQEEDDKDTHAGDVGGGGRRRPLSVAALVRQGIRCVDAREHLPYYHVRTHLVEAMEADGEKTHCMGAAPASASRTSAKKKPKIPALGMVDPETGRQFVDFLDGSVGLMPPDSECPEGFFGSLPPHDWEQDRVRPELTSEDISRAWREGLLRGAQQWRESVRNNELGAEEVLLRSFCPKPPCSTCLFSQEHL